MKTPITGFAALIKYNDESRRAYSRSSEMLRTCGNLMLGGWLSAPGFETYKAENARRWNAFQAIRRLAVNLPA